MENFREMLKQNLLETLNISLIKAEEVCNFLIEEHGLESIQDLRLLTEDDLAPVLKTVQRRKFLLSWMPQNTSIEVDNVECSSQLQNEVLEQPLINELQKCRNDWLSRFSVPWERMSCSLLKTLNAQKRPSPEQRRELVRAIADAIMQYTRLPGVKALRLISQLVVDKYPMMKDSLSGDVIEGGNMYLCKQIRNRIENRNRGAGIKRKATSQVTESQVVSKDKQFGLSDRYGCINWQPSLTEEQAELLEKEREALFNHSLKGPTAENDPFVKISIEKTYPLQRREINILPFDIVLFKSRWPCVFSKPGFLKHFEELVGIDLHQRLKEQLEKKANRIITFLKTVPTGSNKKLLTSVIETLEDETAEDSESLLDPKEPDFKDLGVLINLLTGYFGEDIGSIFKACEGATNQMNAQRIIDLPCTPIILVCGGSIFSCNNFMILIDGIVVNDDLKSYYDAFLIYMAAYFVFNIKYPVTVAATMEFIQRCMMNINPSRGNKHRKSCVKDGIMPRVLSLLNNMTDYEWL